MRFGKLTVIGEGGFNGHKQPLLLCRCDCGVEKKILRASLRRGVTRSCGCAKLRANGDANNHKGRAPEYNIWAGMRARCLNRNHEKWPDYGGRGIKVCEQWTRSYKQFIADVGRRPSPQHSLDRIDNDGHYEPGNVRWATKQQQVRNRRPVRISHWRHAPKLAADYPDLSLL